MLLVTVMFSVVEICVDHGCVYMCFMFVLTCALFMESWCFFMDSMFVWSCRCCVYVFHVCFDSCIVYGVVVCGVPLICVCFLVYMCVGVCCTPMCFGYL